MSSADGQGLLSPLWTLAEGARWFSGRSRGGRPESVELAPWLSEPSLHAPGVCSAILHVSYPTGGVERYHVPLAAYPAGAAPIAPLATVAGTDFVEAADDPAAMAVLLSCLAEDRGGLIHSRPIPQGLRSRRFAGEQSNTSVFCGERLIAKIFRRLEDGPNLDVELHEVLAGSGAVAELYGTWSYEGTHLGVFLEALTDPKDGFNVACQAAEAGRQFDEQAHAIGEQLALVHQLLRDRLPVGVVSGDALAATFTARFDAAAAEVPLLEQFRDKATQAFETVRGCELPAQRIHGDCHLGQVLLTDGRWRFVDFEGEPLKSLTERRQVDSIWRDVAGMLRSFDYATARSNATCSWRDNARYAFLKGFDADATDVLLAYEFDKAVYEVLYESRNRPAFLSIPVDYLQHFDN